jgi:VWFA-related protein
MSALNTSLGMCLALTAGVAVLSQAPPQTPLPTFRTGIDVVELDVTVLDKDRRPVRGLTAADFSILEHGKPQPIVAFAAIDVPAPPAASAPWIRDAPLDVVNNDSENRRLVAIVMDDAYTGFEPDFMKRAKQIGRSAIDQLGPGDLASVIFTFQGRSQNFTADREKLRAAVDSFLPKSTARDGPPIPCMMKLNSCDVQSLATVASTMLSAPPGRKIAILISGGRGFTFGEMGDPSSRNEMQELQDMFRNLQRANITVYAFDAQGLLSTASVNESLYSFAASTGGRAITNTNDPAPLVAGAFSESSSYYLVGFQSSSAASDNRFHKVDVKVNRPGVEVRTRNGYYAPPKKPAPVETINGLPGGDLPLEATTAAFPVPGRSAAEVVVVGHVASAEHRNVSLTTTAIDLDGRQHGTGRQSIEITPAPGSPGPDLLSHLPLPPGRYMVQLSAESDGKSGSVFVDVEVPNFAKDSLSMSGLLVERRPAAAVRDKAIAALIPVSPTTLRAFTKDDAVDVFAKVNQGGKGRLLPVKMSAKVTDARNEIVSRYDLVLEPEQFGAARGAEYRVGLPLAHLDPGDYLFEVEARSGAPLVRRTVRFSIARGGP